MLDSFPSVKKKTFCLQIYSEGPVRMKEETWALSSQQWGIFYMQHSTDRIVHTIAFVHQLWSTGWKEK